MSADGQPQPHYGDTIDRYLHKVVALRYHGTEIELALSQALFSSFDVDSGSRLLLKTLAGVAPEGGRVLDLGCGTGVLGIALAKRHGATITFRDRDALALSFAAHNASRNAVATHLAGGVGLVNLDDTLETGPFELVVANLPAKAGTPVLGQLLAEAAGAAPGGRVAVVVVNPLASQTLTQIAPLGELALTEEGPRHTAFHFLPADSAAAPVAEDPLHAYHRGRELFEIAGAPYQLTTCYGLPDFDTASHASRLAASLLRRAQEAEGGSGSGRSLQVPAHCLLVNPGQGHVAAWLALSAAMAIGPTGWRFSLVSRDALQLLATRDNLRAQGVPAAAVELHHRAFPCAEGQPPVDLAVVMADEDLQAEHRPRLLEELQPCLRSGARLALSARGSAFVQIVKARRGYRLVRQTKRRIVHAALLVRE